MSSCCPQRSPLRPAWPYVPQDAWHTWPWSGSRNYYPQYLLLFPRQRELCESRGSALTQFSSAGTVPGTSDVLPTARPASEAPVLLSAPPQPSPACSGRGRPVHPLLSAPRALPKKTQEQREPRRQLGDQCERACTSGCIPGPCTRPSTGHRAAKPTARRPSPVCSLPTSGCRKEVTTGAIPFL